ncbi:MAG: hypothetical protein OXC37_00325, partial [Bdellovibrionaceae bacterium]|nr:hypothetical protein [Pseudobdellovibrionaceae bacterium]
QGFDAQGDKVCVNMPKGVNTADADCGAGKVLKGFNSNGNKICVDSDRSLANVKCPDGQMLQGFDAQGKKVCVLSTSGEVPTKKKNCAWMSATGNSSYDSCPDGKYVAGVKRGISIGQDSTLHFYCCSFKSTGFGIGHTVFSNNRNTFRLNSHSTNIKSSSVPQSNSRVIGEFNLCTTQGEGCSLSFTNSGAKRRYTLKASSVKETHFGTEHYSRSECEALCR